ncbi:MAG: bifunctional methylenetetrahydrofolate dehydrogenase/methenyltetrahydrofolate cyclohydrolase FolD [Candidatus Kapaibacterium sp.]|nr:bifunctional methylenetetrahydrofolate dehydrogenase/methenyltetrahydrofolate cyclohydrolase FolD [Ignavibacteriota bacterium]MCB9220948.1 bifunctional methylenetetrahydrofolate dehydrogenase/methenyltetrahydrofolate cyclohydrolase FolD [Ignavibacteria bacterium]
MMTKIIDGKQIANKIKEEVRENTAKLYKDKGIKPGLAILLVGNDPASESYVRSKERNSENMDFHFVMERRDSNIAEDEVLNLIDQWNNDDEIHGILIQLPLPKHIDENKVLLKINPDKDVDGFHPVNLGRLVIGLEGLVPCTPAGIVELLKRSDIETKGKHVVVLGRSNIVGKPVANLLYQKKEGANAIVTICHSAADDVFQYTKQADILIVAIGSANFIKDEHIKEGCAIIDVGINRIDADNEKGYEIVGDVDFNSVIGKASAITPVPGGVGPMTIAMLMNNTYKSASQ